MPVIAKHCHMLGLHVFQKSHARVTAFRKHINFFKLQFAHLFLIYFSGVIIIELPFLRHIFYVYTSVHSIYHLHILFIIQF